jgi:hypothetical protein
MTHIGLALNEDKTRLRDARCDAFDFLGYTFGPMYSPRTGGRYDGVRPSQKAVASIQGAIRHRLRPGNQAPWEDVARTLNRTVRGWCSYFSYGTVTKARHDVGLCLYHSGDRGVLEVVGERVFRVIVGSICRCVLLEKKPSVADMAAFEKETVDRALALLKTVK